MKGVLPLLIPVVAVCFSAGPVEAQSWSGILSPSRAVDWSTAGIPGGIPSGSWTQCGSTVAAYSGTAAAINSAIAACGTNQYVQLGAGTFNLSNGIDFNHKSNVVLRGAGANQTLLVFSGSGTNFYGFTASIGITSSDGTYANAPPANVYNWTGGYAQGSTSITLSSTAGIVPNQTMLFLDQCNDGYSGASCSGTATDTGSVYVCDDVYATSGPHGCNAGSIGTNAYRPHRSQIQIVMPTAVNASTGVVTISPGLHMPNWRAGQTPQVWLVQSVSNSGVENLSIDNSASSADSGVLLFNSFQCWARGLRIVKAVKGPLNAFESLRPVFQDNYIYSAQNIDPYGINFQIDSSALVVNNIIQQVRSPIVLNGPSSGSVFAYNYTVDDYLDGTNMVWAFWNHSAGIAMDLWEGNYAPGFANDDIHGSHHMITRFRNYFSGREGTETSQTNPDFEAAYNRFGNLVGNVLGTSGYHTQYQDTTANSALAIYINGYGNCCTTPPVPVDPLVNTTLLRWGNYDTVTGAVRWCGNSSSPGWSSTCGSSSEIPTSLSSYANSVPSSTALPASFFLAAQPSWWPSGKAWPVIGPDVSGGNVANLAGHVNTIPALDCFRNVMGGPADGTGSVLSFNANTCYGTLSGGSGTSGTSGGSGSGVTVAPPTSVSTVSIR